MNWNINKIYLIKYQISNFISGNYTLKKYEFLNSFCLILAVKEKNPISKFQKVIYILKGAKWYIQGCQWMKKWMKIGLYFMIIYTLMNYKMSFGGIFIKLKQFSVNINNNKYANNSALMKQLSWDTIK